MSLADDAIQYAEKNAKSHLAELKQFVSIPSVSAQPVHRDDVQRAAVWLRDWIVSEGGESELLETDGNPLVWGSFESASVLAPTVLVYGHYDVQPVDPVDLWDSDPFEPVGRGDRLYARGASDMKAQVMAALFAIRSLRSFGDLPVNIRILFEGEEEIGSPSMAAALKKYGPRFAADVCLNPDTGMIAEDVPALRYGLRGLAYFEIHLTGPERDLHSGAYGGVVHNPAQALAELLSGMHDADGRVSLPGFYDRVREIDAAEKKRLALVPFGDDEVKSQTGVPETWGEAGFTAGERVVARPTLEINGMISGYTEPGAKTVIPSKAMAKISTRLVPDQSPQEVAGQLEAYLKKAVPPTVRWELVQLAGGDAFINEPTSPAHVALLDALKTVWKAPAVLSRSGGSVPVAADLQNILGIPSVLTGFALPGDNVHSPNESQHIPTWYRGIEALIRFFENYGRASSTPGTE